MLVKSQPAGRIDEIIFSDTDLNGVCVRVRVLCR